MTTGTGIKGALLVSSGHKSTRVLTRYIPAPSIQRGWKQCGEKRLNVFFNSVNNRSQSLCLPTIDSTISIPPTSLPAKLTSKLLLPCTDIEEMKKKVVEEDLLLQEERYTVCHLS